MTTKFGKLTAWMIAAAMLLTLMPMTAFAATDLTDSTTSVTLKDADGDSYYEVGTPDELMAFANIVNAEDPYISIELTKDIDMTGKEWSTIVFCGKIDGNGHTISNLEMIPTITEEGEYIAGFLYAQCAMVKNIYFENCSAIITNDIECSRDIYAAIIAPAAILSSFENCTAINCTVAQNGAFKNMSYAGGLIGIAAPSNVNFCSYQGGSVSAASTDFPSYVGGLVGNMWDVMAEEDPDNWKTVTISNSFCSANLSANSDSGIVGGILGYDAQELSDVSHVYENCYFSGNISSAANAGGLIGDNCAKSTISNCAVLSDSISATAGDPFVYGEWAQKDTYVTYLDMVICEDTEFVANQPEDRISGKYYLSDLYLDGTWSDEVSTISSAEADAYQISNFKSNLYGKLADKSANVSITLSQNGNVVYTDVTDADGEYNFGKQVLPGEYTLNIAADTGYEAYQQTVTISYATNVKCDITRTAKATPVTSIVSYEKQAAKVVSATTGKYVVIFADYDGDALANVNFVECDLTAGEEKDVAQTNTSFTLGAGDKVMLWDSLTAIAPQCDALIIK